MFENILGQNSVIERLKQDIRKKTLPSSLLFYGEPYSGKLTTALEVARVLTCEKGTADWNCECVSCSEQRLLTHPSTLMLGNRYFFQEMTACADVLSRNKKKFALYMFIRSIRKLTRRFDPNLTDGSGKTAGILQEVRNVEDLLSQLDPGSELPSEKNLKKITSNILEKCGKIVKTLNTNSIPVGQIRKATFWVHTSTPSLNKIVILENADTMLGSASNAVLKILEEPPENVYFILLSVKKSTIIPTLQSRLRPYHFETRDNTGSKDVLSKIFRETSREYDSLKAYFLAWNNVNQEVVKEYAKKISSLLVAWDDGFLSRDLPPILAAAKEDRQFVKALLEEIAAKLRELLLLEGENTAGPLFYKKITLWNKLINDAYRRIETFNQRPDHLLEQMFYRMEEA